ncbi:hypothetical protein GTK01_19820 [Aliihoeflea sp. 40Bstr573]|nr:hypothetical protein [Aliihoeflea sp. 40Bstr573]
MSEGDGGVGLILKSERELQRIEVLSKVLERRMTVGSAAHVLNMTTAASRDRPSPLLGRRVPKRRGRRNSPRRYRSPCHQHRGLRRLAGDGAQVCALDEKRFHQGRAGGARGSEDRDYGVSILRAAMASIVSGC